MRLARELLERSPEETSRRRCLALLAEAAEALGRFAEAADDESLHDFRVALRRLRSTIRAYRPFLKGSRPKRLRKRLAALASSTNLARDVEVQMAWLSTAGAKLGDEASRAAEHLHDELVANEAARPSAERLRKSFDKLRHSVDRAFRRMRLDHDHDRTFLSATGGLLAARGSALRRALDGVASANDLDELHRARIEAKRLRYLLEPLGQEVRGARSIVRKVKTLQDCLGELQDARVLTETIAKALEKAVLEQARRLRERALGQGSIADEIQVTTEAGLHGLLEAQRKRRDDRFDELSRDWLGAAGSSFFDQVSGLAARLVPTPALRWFLLTSVPDSVRSGVPVSIRQGYLPGKRIAEQVRCERRGRRTRYFRVVDVAGRTVEEPISRESFDTLWPLTEKSRLELSRYDFEQGGRAGHVDVFAENDIVLAELESVPEWLEPFVVREVRRSRIFGPRTLARIRSALEIPADPKASEQ